MTYKPQPINTDDIILDEEILILSELLASAVHDQWSIGRINEGWTYGPKRNDEKKTTPCLIPYNELPDNEKAFDRNTAVLTLKLIQKLGFTLKKS